MTTVRVAVRRRAFLVLAGALVYAGAFGATLLAAEGTAPSDRCALGLAAKIGAARPDVASDAALRHTLLSAGTIAFTGDASSGAAFRQLLAALGIGRQIDPRLVDTGNGDPLELVVEGRADLGVSSRDRIATTPGVQALPLPATPGRC
jgi:molybdate transport system substrate-binding protein